MRIIYNVPRQIEEKVLSAIYVEVSLDPIDAF